MWNVLAIVVALIAGSLSIPDLGRTNRLIT